MNTNQKPVSMSNFTWTYSVDTVLQALLVGWLKGERWRPRVPAWWWARQVGRWGALQQDLQSGQPRDPLLGETPRNVAVAPEVCKQPKTSISMLTAGTSYPQCTREATRCWTKKPVKASRSLEDFSALPALWFWESNKGNTAWGSDPVCTEYKGKVPTEFDEVPLSSVLNSSWDGRGAKSMTIIWLGAKGADWLSFFPSFRSSH